MAGRISKLIDQLIKLDITDIILSFIVGLIVLLVLYWVVRFVLSWLRKRGGIYEDYSKGWRSIGLSTKFAAIEQFLFFLAAMAEKEVLAGAIAGWLVLKGIHSYGRWQSSRQEIAEEAKKKGIKDLAGKLGLDPEHYLQGLARNRFLVFSIGTALSISAGALASLACQETFKLLRAP